jgi:hypothetical protein
MGVRGRVSAALALSLALTLARPAAAQTQTGEIFGKVTDGSGGVLPGAVVTIESPALLAPQSATASETGAYRFPNIPIGVYSVRFELGGFKTLVRDGVRIEIGFAAEVNAKLEISTVQETITVSGESPVVDTTSVRTGETFNREALESIPSARDPWVVLEMTPGMVMNQQNVGGNKSGQQSTFTVHGTQMGNTMWNLDGVTITDMAATGSSPVYYDFDAFEEIQIQTGGNDASMQTGGVNLNMVTKSGSNSLKGSSRFLLVDDGFQSDNVTDELRAQNAGSGNPVKNIKDYGVEIGGPIRRNKAWFWGGFGKQDIRVGVLGFVRPGGDPNNPDDLETDLTVLENYNGKINVQPAPSHQANFHYSFSDKIRNARGVGPTVRIEAASKQTGPAHTYKGAHRWIVSDRLVLETQASYFDGGFVLDFTSPELADVQAAFDTATGISSRSGTRSGPFERPQTQINSDANWFVSNRLGGDHAIKFGAKWRRTPSYAEQHRGGFAQARFVGGVASRADLFRDSVGRNMLATSSAYLNDSYSRGRVTINLGVRMDFQDDSVLEASVVENPIVPELLPAVNFPGVDAGLRTLDWSPRVGFTWDLSGDGRTVIKASSSIFYGQGFFASDALNPLNEVRLRFPWTDRNGDTFIQRDELDLRTPQLVAGNYDFTNPGSPRTSNQVDPDLKNDRVIEAIVGIDRELVPNLGVSAAYIYRRIGRFFIQERIGLSPDAFTPVTRSYACGNTSCDQPSYSATYYTLPFNVPTVQRLTHDALDRSFHGIELSARKRFSGKWMMSGSLTLNNTVGRWALDGFQDPLTAALVGAGAAVIGDPTNYDAVNGHQALVQNARWTAKLSGMYAFPWGINASAFLNARDGFPFNRTVLSPADRGGRLSQVFLLIEPWAARRYDDMFVVDARVEKKFTFGRVSVIPGVDVFNLGNANTVLTRQHQQTASTANNVLEVLAPRVLRFGARVTF